jgi:phenylacetate-coenzyme A ligase PaaK-like adenylate-forming protein
MYIFRKLIHSYLRKDEIKSLSEAQQRLTISAEKLQNLREKKFQKLYQAALLSPYYSKVLGHLNIKNIKDINKIPILTKEILIQEYANIISPPHKSFLIADSTSGSTGTKTLFGSDVRDNKGADAIRGNELTKGYNFLEKMVVFWGADRDITSTKLFNYYYNYYVKRIKIISTYHMTDDDIKHNISFLNSFKPNLIVGYPSALSYMADYIAKNPKILRHRPKAIVSAGEMLYDVQRENIEKNFRTRVFNRYGCREVGHIASECTAHKGLHYDADRLIVEILDDDGNPCAPHVPGNVVITDLNNYAFPFIRYQIGDRASLSDATTCECGCTLPMLEEIEGRSFDIVRGINGNSVSGSFWTLALRFKVKGIDKFQIRQREIDDITVKVMVNDAFDIRQKENIIKLVKDKLGDETKVCVEIVTDFEYSPTGKFKWVVSECNTA